MNILHTSKILEKFQQERFSINGPPVASCNSYNNEAINLNLSDIGNNKLL